MTRPSWSTLAAALLVAAAFLLPAELAREKSVTFDEVAHVPAGHSYLATGRIELNPMHPPLLKEIGALPLLFLDLGEVPEPTTNPTVHDQWDYGRGFLARSDLSLILGRARLPAVLLSTALAALILVWSRTLWGTGGGLLAAALYVFDPTILAHAPLVTTDVGFAFFAMLFLWVLRGFVADRSWGRLAACGLTLGLALGSKFSGVVLVPMAALLLASCDRDPSHGPARHLAGAAAALLAMAALAFAVLWAIYLFPSDPFFYVNGVRALGADHTPGYVFYLMGEFRREGWPHYFLVAWLVKTPLPTLLLVASSIVAAVAGLRSKLRDELLLVVPIAGFFVAYSVFAAPQGVRYLIPCFPFLYVFCGRLAQAAVASRPAKATLAAMLGWLVVEVGAIWPDPMAYFNQIAGGWRGGHRWLDDSNVDWGQGLRQLGTYVEKEGIEHPRVCAFWHFDPRVYGIAVTPVEISDLVRRRPEGRVILSGHCVARVGALLSLAHGDGPRNWMARAEPTDVVGHVYWVYDLGPSEEAAAARNRE